MHFLYIKALQKSNNISFRGKVSCSLSMRQIMTFPFAKREHERCQMLQTHQLVRCDVSYFSNN